MEWWAFCDEQDKALWRNYAFVARYGRQGMADMAAMPYPDFINLLLAVRDHIAAENSPMNPDARD